MNISLDLAQFQKIWSQVQAYFSQHVLSSATTIGSVLLSCNTGSSQPQRRLLPGAVSTLICCWYWNRRSGIIWKIQLPTAPAPG